jgi:hypothetical protein
MQTITELSRELDERREAARRKRDMATKQIEHIIAEAKQAARANLTAEEDARSKELFETRDAATVEIGTLTRQIEEATRVALEERQIIAQQSTITPTATRRASYDRVMRVGREERTYRPDHDPEGKGFLLDVSRQFLHADVRAGERLSQHMREESVERSEYLERAVGTGAWAGLVVPQYLTDMYAPATAALRPIADVATKHTLPESGMSLNISRVTTASSVANQASENATVSLTDMDDTLLTVNIQTAAGQQTISRQAIERGTGVEEVTVQDLFRRYATNLDSTIITQATTGLATVAQSTTYTSAAPTAAELWPILFQAQSKLEQTLLGMAMPDYIAMHSRRWNWLCAQVGTSFPFIGGGDGVPPQTGGVIVTNQYGAGVRGVLSNGMKVIVDNNIETTVNTNQDPIYVLASGELHLWEDPNAPMLIRAEQPAAASLGVLLVLYGYYGYTAQRYTNNPGRITGTGLAAPAGF